MSLSIKNPSERTNIASVIGPVPDFAALVRNGGKSRNKTTTVNDFVASIAPSAGTGSSIKGSALIGSRDTETSSIEVPSIGALKTLSVGPVPFAATTISGFSIVGGGKEAGTVDEVVTSITAGTISVVVVSFALIRDRRAGIISIQNPKWRTFDADSVIPLVTALISGGGVVRFREHTNSFNEVIANVAG